LKSLYFDIATNANFYYIEHISRNNTTNNLQCLLLRDALFSFCEQSLMSLLYRFSGKKVYSTIYILFTQHYLRKGCPGSEYTCSFSVVEFLFFSESVVSSILTYYYYCTVVGVLRTADF